MLVAYGTMLGKQWSADYLLNEGGPMIKRCADRQCRRDKLEKGLSTALIVGLSIGLQFSLLVFVGGVLVYIWDINHTFGIVLVFAFYLPSALVMFLLHLHTSRTTGLLTTLHPLWKATLRRNSPHAEARHHSHSPSPPTAQPPPHSSFHLTPRLSQTLPPIRIGLPTVTVTSRWWKSGALATFQEMNAGDIRCVSWILWNVASPEVIDTAICFAGIIRWFEDGLDVKLPRDLIVLILKACFDPSGRVYPGLRNRAYYSIRAIVWIKIHAMFVPEEFAPVLPLQTIHYDTTSLDPDLHDLLRIYNNWDAPDIIETMYRVNPTATPTHLQWTSNALLRLSWANRILPDATSSSPGEYRLNGGWSTIPLNAVLNRLLASCIFLDWPIGEEVLKIQDKSCAILYPCLPSYSHRPF